MNLDTADLDWYRRIRDNQLVAVVAVICPDCILPVPDIDAVKQGLGTDGNCQCIAPIDYKDVVEVHGLGLFTSIFKNSADFEDDMFKDMKEHS